MVMQMRGHPLTDSVTAWTQHIQTKFESYASLLGYDTAYLNNSSFELFLLLWET